MASAHIIERHNPVQMGILAVLVIMMSGTWYIAFMKYLEQQRILNQAKTLEKKFWTSATLSEGIDKLPKNSVFRAVAEAGQKASQGGTTLVGLNDWIAMSLTRQLEDANAHMQGGIALPRLGRFDLALRRSDRHGVGHSRSPDLDRRCRSDVDRQGRRPRR